jgi:LmbE family N-acetylglucosaminyl deacetylase
MAEPLRLLCVLAHPDDESLGTGGIFAKYAAEGIDTFLITATRGERGWVGIPEVDPGMQGMARIREAELAEAAKFLGIKELCLLDYVDGDLDQAPPQKVISEIAAFIRHVRPQVVVTFGADGLTGHTDHIAISQFTSAAIVQAANSESSTLGSPFSVSKLYHMVLTQHTIDVYLPLFGDISMEVDGVKRLPLVWPKWAVTTQLDTADYWSTVWQAVACHCSQLTNYTKLVALTEEQQRVLWGEQPFYRVFSAVNSGRAVETDLFEGLR